MNVYTFIWLTARLVKILRLGENNLKVKIFIKNAIILTTASFINMAIGIFFRIYMSNKIGAEAMGLYQLIASIYLFATTFSTTGVSLTVTRLVTDFVAKKEYDKAKSVTKKCLFFGIIVGTISGVLLFYFSENIGFYILNDQRTISSLKILSVALPFIAISSCYRGYFFALRQVIKTASEQLFEQMIEIIIFILLICKFLPAGIEYASIAMVIGTTISEILSCVYSYVLYKKDEFKSTNFANKNFKFMKNIVSIFFPLTASASLRALLSTIENILIPSGLKKYGQSSSSALSIYGTIMGMVLPVIAFPTVFLLSFSMLLIPEMSEANAINKKEQIKSIAAKVLNITLIFSLLIMGIFFFFSNELGICIYSSGDCGTYIRLLAPLIPLMYMDKVVDGMLKGLNEQLSYLSYNIIDSAIRVLLIFLLTPKIGIKGFIIMMFVSTILNSTLSINRLLKVANVKLKLFDWILKPFICIIFSSMFVKIIFYNFYFQSIYIFLSLQVIFSTFIYCVLLYITGCIGKKELLFLKSIF